MDVRVLHGDALELLPTLSGLDSVVCDPPYHLGEVPHVKRGGFGGERSDERKVARRGFMGKQWDGGDIALRPETWALVLQALKPGAHLLAFGGTRTFHRMACAIEDAGFEIRDTIMWVYGSGFPKSRNLDGAWSGWGTALKPAWEPIIVARKPLVGTVVQNVLRHGTGAINVDGCRVQFASESDAEGAVTGQGTSDSIYGGGKGLRPLEMGTQAFSPHTAGRWPANLCLSFPEDQYILRSDVTTAQKQELYRWFHENA